MNQNPKGLSALYSIIPDYFSSDGEIQRSGLWYNWMNIFVFNIPTYEAKQAIQIVVGMNELC